MKMKDGLAKALENPDATNECETDVPSPWKRGAFAFSFILLPCTTHFTGVVTLFSSSQCVTSSQLRRMAISAVRLVLLYNTDH